MYCWEKIERNRESKKQSHNFPHSEGEIKADAFLSAAEIQVLLWMSEVRRSFFPPLTGIMMFALFCGKCVYRVAQSAGAPSVSPFSRHLK